MSSLKSYHITNHYLDASALVKLVVDDADDERGRDILREYFGSGEVFRMPRLSALLKHYLSSKGSSPEAKSPRRNTYDISETSSV